MSRLVVTDQGDFGGPTLWKYVIRKRYYGWQLLLVWVRCNLRWAWRRVWRL